MVSYDFHMSKSVKVGKPKAKKHSAQARPASARPTGRGKKGAGPVPEGCEERLRFETLLTELSAGFIHLPADQVGAAIVDAQHRVCDCLRLDLCVLWQWNTRRPAPLR